MTRSPAAPAWGGLVLGEALTGRMLAGAGVVLVGTALATGVVALPSSRHGGARWGSAPIGGASRPE
jgi:hypothetical protein